MEKQIENIIRKIKDGSLILWVGSGYSRRLGFPDWKGLIKKLGEEHYKEDKDCLNNFLEKLDKPNCNLLELLESLNDKENRNVLLGRLTEIFKLPHENIHDSRYNPFRKLWEITDKIITTNYDLALDITKKGEDCRTILWNREKDYSTIIENRAKYLFKLHGSIKYSESCVVFKDQYDNVYKKIYGKLKPIYKYISQFTK